MDAFKANLHFTGILRDFSGLLNPTSNCIGHRGIEILQEGTHIKTFLTPDQGLSPVFMEIIVTLEEGCAWMRNSERPQH